MSLKSGEWHGMLLILEILISGMYDSDNIYQTLSDVCMCLTNLHPLVLLVASATVESHLSIFHMKTLFLVEDCSSYPRSFSSE